MPFIDLGMEVIRQTWYVSLVAAKFIILAVVAFAAVKKGSRPLNPLDTLRYGLSTSLMALRHHIIYGLMAGGIVLLLLTGSPLPAYLVVAGIMTHGLYRLHQAPPEYEAVDRRFSLSDILIHAAIVSSILAVGMQTAFLNHLAALFLYATIFYRI